MLGLAEFEEAKAAVWSAKAAATRSTATQPMERWPRCRVHAEIDNRLARKICQQLAIAAIR